MNLDLSGREAGHTYTRLSVFYEELVRKNWLHIAEAKKDGSASSLLQNLHVQIHRAKIYQP